MNIGQKIVNQQTADVPVAMEPARGDLTGTRKLLKTIDGQSISAFEKSNISSENSIRLLTTKVQLFESWNTRRQLETIQLRAAQSL